MRARSRHRRSPRSRALPALLCAVAALACAAVAVASLRPGGGSATAGGLGAQAAQQSRIGSDGAEIKRQLAQRLHRDLLRPHWIACVHSGRRYEGAKVLRCNVDYGEPHIVAYCAVLSGGRLLTDRQQPAIPCGPDRAGWHSPILTFR